MAVSRKSEIILVVHGTFSGPGEPLRVSRPTTDVPDPAERLIDSRGQGFIPVRRRAR